MANPTATAGPSASDIKSDPGLAPEAMVRGENLHKASTDRGPGDIVEAGASAKDVWVIEAKHILVRADSEDAAKSKFLAALGVAFDTRDVTARNAKSSELANA